MNQPRRLRPNVTHASSDATWVEQDGNAVYNKATARLSDCCNHVVHSDRPAERDDQLYAVYRRLPATDRRVARHAANIEPSGRELEKVAGGRRRRVGRLGPPPLPHRGFGQQLAKRPV